MSQPLQLTFKSYLSLIKPGIIWGNAITALCGFALASKGQINFDLFLAMLLGLSLIIASACVFNNYIDRDADKIMDRTKNRPLVKGEITLQNALFFAFLLFLVGSFVLAFFTNFLTLQMALLGFGVYVFWYSIWKYRTLHGTVIGSIAGGVPPVVGYCSVSNQLDLGAFILFMIVVFWQMPHFFAIAMYRFDDYKAASIPVLPVKKGFDHTKVQMLLYILAFIVATLMLTVFGYTRSLYIVLPTLLGFVWLWLSIKGFYSTNNKAWARNMFLFSLVIITIFCIMISLDSLSL